MSTFLKSYDVEFRSDADFASYRFKAETPEAALAAAMTFHHDHHDKLHFEAYDLGVHEINMISVCDETGNEVATWHSVELTRRWASLDLLVALMKAVIALNTAPRFKIAALQSDSYKIASECGRAIAKAKGDAE